MQTKKPVIGPRQARATLCDVLSLRATGRFWVVVSFVLLFFVVGCVSKRKAEMEARQAYMAGQQQASQATANTLVVAVQGQVRNHLIPWTIDLTLAKAIVAANYVGIFNPRIIRVIRNGQTTEVDPSDLLKGQDMPLEAGDTVQIVN